MTRLTVLQRAVGHGHLSTVRMLLGIGADVDARYDGPKKDGECGGLGCTALYLAAMCNNAAAARLLIEAGADVNTRRILFTRMGDVK